MSSWDWLVFTGLLLWIVIDGLLKSGRNRSSEDAFLAGRSARWWVVGLSIMATQASAITMIGTTGKGWQEGTRFLQFYYSLPIAMIVIAYTVVPHFARYRVFTAYEYLGLRFDDKTRSASAIVFCALRTLSAGIVIYAPAVILSGVLHTSIVATTIAMGVVAIVYTSFGGMRAVLSTDVKQMGLMAIGLVVALIFAIRGLPEGVSISGAAEVLAASERLVWADWRVTLSERYTIFSSFTGGLFLFLAYFGTDQSQVQRYLSGRSVREQRRALFMNAALKIPFQALVLFLGAMLFFVFLKAETPLSFVPELQVHESQLKYEKPELVADYELALIELRRVSRAASTGEPVKAETIRKASEDYRASRERIGDQLSIYAGGPETSETNYAFPYFILNALPIGLAGLIFAAIFAAALSSVDSELNALAAVILVDLAGSEERPDGLPKRRLWTVVTVAGCGLVATGFALLFGGQKSIVDTVNEVGSYFYGSLLGAFILALGFSRANGHGAFWGILAGMGGVMLLRISFWLTGEPLPFLLQNTVGTLATVSVGLLVSIRRPL